MQEMQRDMVKKVLIVGAGHAAGQCAATLRQKKYDGDITLVGDEAHPPYQRPPLSKDYLAGELETARLYVKPPAFFEKENVTLHLNKSAQSIDRKEKKVSFSDDHVEAYDKLVLATGARVRKLNCPGADLPGVGYVRSIVDVEAMQEAFSKEGARIVIVGAGYIGLEVAAVAAKRGLDVTVLEIGERVMARVTSPTVSDFFQRFHKDRGVDIRLGVGIEAFEGDGRVETAVLTTGEKIPCDMAVVGVGILPNDDLAREAGLETDDGIIVDAITQTSDPDIFAIGDCTRHPSNYFGGMLRLESVHNAIEQGKTAAAAILGDAAPYDQVPWFWSNQFDLKLQTVGICTGRYDREVVRGSVDDAKFSVFYLSGDQLIAVDSINMPGDHMASRRIIAMKRPVDGDMLEDPDFELKTLMRA
ncbi:MAG: FAD-dependent oxidoreductase [Pseudomonadota bacterium]